MNMLLLFGLLVLNFGISFWNAYASGAYLTESKIVGGWARFVTWCGLVMSACGFTWVYLTILTMVTISAGYLTQEQGQAMFELGYLVIILPVLGSGFGIWAHSLAVAFRERNLGSVAVAGYNTFAQGYNTWQAARHAPGAFQHVLKVLSPKGKGSKDSGAIILIVLLVILALAGGSMTTAAIAKWADKRVALDVTGGSTGRLRKARA
jgi:hypothetical protein